MTGIHYIDAKGPDGMRIYAIGDVHGRRDLLEKLLAQIDAQLELKRPADWRIILLGDYVDRGPDSRGVLDLIIARQAADQRVIALGGNHDFGFLQFLETPSEAHVFTQNGGRDMTENASNLEFRRRGQSGVLGFPAHDGRMAALSEVHARPHASLDLPRVVIQLAFMTEGGSSVDQAVLADLARRNGVTPPESGERHFAMKWQDGNLRWERHTEFSTYQWDGPLKKGASEPPPFGDGFNPPGTVISGIRLEIHKWTKTSEALVAQFDPTSLCYSLTEEGKAAIVTDFCQDKDGLTHILVLDRGMTPMRRGAVAQRLIDIETYRTLALLALPLALKMSTRCGKIENRLADITYAITYAGTRDEQKLLSELTDLAAQLEADAAGSLYRFGAARAYDGIIAERLDALLEETIPGQNTWRGFLQRRAAPAMRTCRSVEERQANLSRKLTRATTLLRTWIDVELEKQNRDLLDSMNRRAQLQLRLQQTVEGLSVAAVSYYVVGLIGYLAKGSSAFGLYLAPEYVTAAAVPVVILAVWWAVRRIRKSHSEEH